MHSSGGTTMRGFFTPGALSGLASSAGVAVAEAAYKLAPSVTAAALVEALGCGSVPLAA